MGRPKGQYDIIKARVMDALIILTKGGESFCYASDKYLAKKVGRSPRHVRRILLALETAGAIVRQRFLYKMGPAWKTRRHVRLAKPHSRWGYARVRFVGHKAPTRMDRPREEAQKAPLINEIPGEPELVVWRVKEKPQKEPYDTKAVEDAVARAMELEKKWKEEIEAMQTPERRAAALEASMKVAFQSETFEKRMDERIQNLLTNLRLKEHEAIHGTTVLFGRK